MDNTGRTCARPPHAAPAPPSPPGALEGGHADPCRAWLPRARSQRGALQPQLVGTHRPNARDTLPQGASPEHRLQGVVPQGAARLAPGPMGLAVRGQAPACPCEAVLVRRPHADQGWAASQAGAHLLRLRVGQWPRRRADHRRTVGEGAASQGLRLSPLPCGTRQIARLPRMHHAAGATRSRPPVAATTIRVGGRGDNRSPSVPTPPASCGTAQRSPEGHTAISHGACATSSPPPQGTSTRCRLAARPGRDGLTGPRQLYGLEEPRT
jgi:hypothetical protein